MTRQVARRSTTRSKHSVDTPDSQIPAPFTKAPTGLDRFLERLDPALVYITHIDRHHPDEKKRIFLIPVLLNGLIAVLLGWRVYAAAPTYWAILQTLLGYASSASVDPDRTTWGQQFAILARRTLMLLLDFLLFRFVGPWPLTFFLERPANPVTWRWALGFRREEAVVRVSRGWGRDDLLQGVKQGRENAFFKTRILPAVAGPAMAKTGYLMMDRSWDLEFEVMVDAHVLATRGEIEWPALDKVVWVCMEGVGWLAWRWDSPGGLDGDVVEERRHKVVLFKERLTAMGKESLFWKWMEIVEEERDADGGFTPERQQKVATRVQKEFERDGVDFEELTKSIGGLDEVEREKKS